MCAGARGKLSPAPHFAEQGDKLPANVAFVETAFVDGGIEDHQPPDSRAAYHWRGRSVQGLVHP